MLIGKKEFILTKENYSTVMQAIKEALKEKKVKDSKIIKTALLMEELFVRMTERGKATSVTVTIHKRLGEIGVSMKSQGEEYDPLSDQVDIEEDETEYYRTLILKANHTLLGYRYKGGKNIVSIQVRYMDNMQIVLTLLCMALGVLCGVLMKEFMSQEIISFFDTNIIKTCRTMFLNALNMMIAPVIFFSVISGVTSLTDASDVGRLGGKLIASYGLTTLIASVLSIGIACFVFSGEVPQIGELAAGGASDESAAVSLMSIIVGLVPSNLVDPIAKNEMLQIIFVAVVFGICVNKLGEKVKLLYDIIDVMNTFCLRMILMIVSFIPLIAFLSMASLVFKIGLESLLVLSKMVATQLFGSILMLGVYGVLIYLIGRISPIPFLRKIFSFMPIPLSTSSSNATMPFSMKFCTDRLGISPKVSAFSIPIGATVNMDGTCFYLTTATIMLARMYGIELTPDMLFTVFITVVALSIGAPGVTGGAFVCLASIVTAIGLPVEATAIFLGIDPICSMIRCTFNCSGDIAMSTALASNEKLLDMEVYRRK